MRNQAKSADLAQAKIDHQFVVDALARVKSPVMRYRLTMIFDALTECFAEAESGRTPDLEGAIVMGLSKIAWPRAVDPQAKNSRP